MTGNGKRVLYLGAANGTCQHRADAYRRLGHTVLHIDPRQLLPSSTWIDRLTWRLGGQWLSPWVYFGLRRRLAGEKFDICHVDNGSWLSSGVVRHLRRYAPVVVNYNIDDPFGSRDGRRFAAYLKAIPEYDLLVVMRQINCVEATNLGAKRVLRVFMSADEVAHAPRQLNTEDRLRWDSEVLFLGTWMPERGKFLLELTRQGVPLSIRGAHWHKAPEWSQLKGFWRGGPLEGEDYAKAIQCAKVNLGLLSIGNRDLHTTRSQEIPALGGLLCAERTAEHVQMYGDGLGAFFWSNADECATLCKRLLKDTALRMRVAQAGQRRLIENGHLNERVIASIVQTVDESLRTDTCQPAPHSTNQVRHS